MSENKEPTAEQIKKFWEWCGFKWVRGDGKPYDCYHWLYPNRKQRMDLPELTLDNLFKWAVPKLQKEEYQIDIVCFSDGKYGVLAFKDKILADKQSLKLEVALTKAILDVIK